MGLSKRHMEEIERGGYGDAEGMVCSVCIAEPALVAVVLAEGGGSRCRYCGRVPAAPGASIQLERVIELVVEGLRFEYEDPLGCASWDGREGGYQVRTFGTDDLLWKFGVSGVPEVIDDIADAVNVVQWCERNPYTATEADTLRWGWQAFRKYVQHVRRFTFLAGDDSWENDGQSIPMHRIPAAVVGAIRSSGMTAESKAGTVWWRARPDPSGRAVLLAKDLGAPPDEVARDNRMSPKGIGAFYGASSAAGAQAEVAGYAGSKPVTVGAFTQLSDLTLVDLRDPPPVPSLFDTRDRHLRGMRKFVCDFLVDVTKIAAPSDNLDLSYVPTQIIAEHLRYDLPVDGICWRSTRDREVTSSVLFLSNDAMCDAGTRCEDSRLLLDAKSLVHFPQAPS